MSRRRCKVTHLRLETANHYIGEGPSRCLTRQKVLYKVGCTGTYFVVVEHLKEIQNILRFIIYTLKMSFYDNKINSGQGNHSFRHFCTTQQWKFERKKTKVKDHKADGQNSYQTLARKKKRDQLFLDC